MAVGSILGRPTRARSDLVYPEERLPWGQTVLMGLQHVMAMFGATVLVPIILGFNPSTVIFFSGVATLIFLAVTRGKIPSYLGSSFAFIGPVLAAKASGGNEVAFFGILCAGAVYAVIGLITMGVGPRFIQYLMPPVVTGTVVMIIGLNLAGVAWGSYNTKNVPNAWLYATITLLAAVLISVYVRGFLRLLPVLLGVLAGYVAGVIGGIVTFDPVSKAAWLGAPQFTLPKPSWTALTLIAPVALVLVAENTGHIFAISGMMDRDLSKYLGRGFLGDGLGTMVSGLFGGTGETTYAENIGVMGITRVFSIALFVVAAVVAILLGFIPKFGAIVQSIPVPVLGGIEVYLFGLIAVIGGKIWVDGRVDFSKRANLAVAAVPIILGTANATMKIGNFELAGIGVGAFAAILLYQVLLPGHRLEATVPTAEVAGT
jgi:uracil-xanthine permease